MLVTLSSYTISINFSPADFTEGTAKIMDDTGLSHTAYHKS